MDIPPTIIDAQERLSDRVMALPGVVGTAVGEHNGQPCIKILVVRRTESLIKAIPDQYEGHQVILQETGVIRKLDEP